MEGGRACRQADIVVPRTANLSFEGAVDGSSMSFESDDDVQEGEYDDALDLTSNGNGKTATKYERFPC